MGQCLLPASIILTSQLPVATITGSPLGKL